MLLPNGENAVVDISKLLDYCLDLTNEVGRHKAKVFASALGLYKQDAMVLRSAIVAAARSQEATVGMVNEYGTRYIVDFEMEHDGRTAVIRSGWILDPGSEKPRLITCYVL